MTSNDDEQDTKASARRIQEAKDQVFQHARAMHRDMPRPGPQLKIELGAALVDYRYLLIDYKDERALTPSWDDRDVNVDLVEQKMQQKTTIRIPKKSRGNLYDDHEVPAVADMSARDLLKIAKELDAISKELGFAAAAKSPTPNTKASREDLTGLLRTRGQDQALDNLPESWQEGGENA